MDFLFLMDPLERLSPDKDTTWAFMRAAEKRGHVPYFASPVSLSLAGESLSVNARAVTFPTPSTFAYAAPEVVRDASSFRAVFVRMDPPFDPAYHHTTLLLEAIRGRTRIVNDPRGLREANEKLYAMRFPAFTPKTLVASRRAQIEAFVEASGDVAVGKPLDGAGGAGVFLLRKDDPNFRSIVDTLTFEGRRLAMVQEYLPAVKEGDKRVLLLDGEPLGAILRVPQGGDLRSNIHVGGKVQKAELTAREKKMVDAMAPTLRRDGLVFVGLDVIGERLTEVNVTSPTGIQELSAHMGRDVAEDVIAWAEKA